MKALLRALDSNGDEILGTEFNYVKEFKSFSSLLRTNVYKIARKHVDEGRVASYRVEEFTYSDSARVYMTIA